MTPHEMYESACNGEDILDEAVAYLSSLKSGELMADVLKAQAALLVYLGRQQQIVEGRRYPSGEIAVNHDAA